MNKQITLWAFWRYDLYPYVLGGKVTKTNDDGSVFVEGYGDYKTWARVLVPGKLGQELLEELKSLQAQYRAHEKDLRKRFVTKARMAFNAAQVSFSEFPSLANNDNEDTDG